MPSTSFLAYTVRDGYIRVDQIAAVVPVSQTFEHELLEAQAR